jgi:hypothetical protein
MRGAFTKEWLTVKIKKLSPHRLSIRIWQMDLRFPGILLFIISGFLLAYFSLQYQITCEEREGFTLSRCTLIKKLPLIYRSKLNIGSLKQTYIQPYLSHDGTVGLAYTIMLESKHQLTPLFTFPTPLRYTKNHVSKLIDHFVKFSDKTRFNVPNPQPTLFKYASLFLFLFAIFMIVRVSIVSIFIDKEKNVIYIDWQNLYHSSHRSIDISLLKTVDVQSRLTKKGKRRYRLAFFLKDREVIPFSRRYSYFFNGKRTVALALNRFLGILNTISKGKTVNAGRSHLLNYLLILMAVVVFVYVLFSV